jgi:hypothetical protein
MVEGQTAQQQRVDDGEHHGRQPNTEGECDRRHGGRARAGSQRAPAVAKVASHRRPSARSRPRRLNARGRLVTRPHRCVAQGRIVHLRQNVVVRRGRADARHLLVEHLLQMLFELVNDAGLFLRGQSPACDHAPKLSAPFIHDPPP